MASKNKKIRLGNLETPDTTESSDNGSESDNIEDEEDDYDDEDDEAMEGEDMPGEIQVEFEARTPQECDFDGIKALLQRMV